ncbi:hypothetical protein AT15_08825 [Kosmotoga arenicorallina S304]|uniref:DUF2520 domain-containing protein n=1 Tax=Kosmotoga arenicorallina S304 TaxID=1453497 RepID=A0A176K1P9_9BACT|nr:DUF2520 domain-containing protein [Kosmotoga arenicorallina]OAA31068.1 hypothetical protein AT15_08825 [Kosmotoga arenicorallina S304]
MRISVVGIGKAGSLLAKFFYRKGYSVSHLINRTPEQALKLAHELPGCKAGGFELLAELEDVVIIATSDSAIRDTFLRIWNVNTRPEYFIHLSGAISSRVFEEAAKAEKGVASFHPNLSISSFSISPSLLQKAIFGLEGNEKGIAFLASIAKKEGLRYVNISTESKILYHAAAVFSSNFTQLMLKQAESLYREKLLFDNLSVVELLESYLEGLLKKVKTGTLSEFSGPAARNDQRTLELEQRCLSEINPKLGKLYEELSCMIRHVRGD